MLVDAATSPETERVLSRLKTVLPCLSHELRDVRRRALQNITSKLEMGLVGVLDLPAHDVVAHAVRFVELEAEAGPQPEADTVGDIYYFAVGHFGRDREKEVYEYVMNARGECEDARVAVGDRREGEVELRAGRGHVDLGRHGWRGVRHLLRSSACLCSVASRALLRPLRSRAAHNACCRSHAQHTCRACQTSAQGGARGRPA